MPLTSFAILLSLALAQSRATAGITVTIIAPARVTVTERHDIEVDAAVTFQVTTHDDDGERVTVVSFE